jgi:hypothetical protein
MQRQRRNLPWVVGLGAIVLFGGLAMGGVPLGSLLVLGLVLMCPLMMMGMHSGAGHGDHPRSEASHDGHVERRTMSPPRPDI